MSRRRWYILHDLTLWLQHVFSQHTSRLGLRDCFLYILIIDPWMLGISRDPVHIFIFLLSNCIKRPDNARYWRRSHFCTAWIPDTAYWYFEVTCSALDERLSWHASFFLADINNEDDYLCTYFVLPCKFRTRDCDSSHMVDIHTLFMFSVPQDVWSWWLLN